MQNIDQVIAQIRFQLDQLSTRNAQHDFEHLCRHLTRARICANILPATGPVAAGGDQGRDFETFVTYLRSTSIADSTFVGKISQKPIAFACSIQRRGISSKIKSDVDTIMKSGSPVEAVHYFCTSNVPVSTRHALKDWAKNRYAINLEVQDGNSISELLADREVFWIAQQYLNIPSEIYPRAADEKTWYTASLVAWKSGKIISVNFADFSEVRAATRYATFSAEARQDLPFWLGLLGKFIDDVSLPQLRRKAIYEVAVASLRGLGTLLGQEDHIREYFSTIPELQDATDTEDALALLNYCIGAFPQNKVQLTKDELGSWQDQLLIKVSERLEAVANMPGLRCLYLELRGYLCLSIDPRQPKVPDLKGAVEYWTQLIHVARDAPLFPLERFADRLTKYTRFIGETEGFDQLTQQTDLLLSRRYGDFKTAEKCRDRAIELYKEGKIIKALNQLHQAKVKWFAEETIRASLVSTLLISQLYRELNLSYAAKYYALAAAHIAANSLNTDLKPLIPKALIAAEDCDYSQGVWCGFLDLAEIGLRTYAAFSKHPDKAADEFERALFHIATLMAITKRLDAQLFEFVKGRVHEWKLDEWLDRILPESNKIWEKRSIPEIWAKLNQELGGRPFNDLGAVRNASWSEFGITWNISWKNDYATTFAAEQLIAVLQILLADLSGVDLCLLKTQVNIEISVENLAKPKGESIPSNKERRWKVTLPMYSGKGDRAEFERMNIDTLTVGTLVLADISLLPRERFYDVIRNCFKNGISMKTFVSRPYEVLYRDFVPKETFDRSARAAKTPPNSIGSFDLKQHRELAWIGGPGPGYSKDKANEYLRNRYSRSLIPIRHTLKHLLKSPEFQNTLTRLRSDGWLDWHILSSMYAIALNYRVEQNPDARGDIQVEKKLVQTLMKEPESEASTPVPVEEFKEERIRMQQKFNMLSTLTIYGLVCRQTTPDFESIDHFLRHRYNYWKDDIQHTDPFLSS